MKKEIVLFNSVILFHTYKTKNTCIVNNFFLKLNDFTSLEKTLLCISLFYNCIFNVVCLRVMCTSFEFKCNNNCLRNVISICLAYNECLSLILHIFCIMHLNDAINHSYHITICFDYFSGRFSHLCRLHVAY